MRQRFHFSFIIDIGFSCSHYLLLFIHAIFRCFLRQLRHRHICRLRTSVAGWIHPTNRNGAQAKARWVRGNNHWSHASARFHRGQNQGALLAQEELHIHRRTNWHALLAAANQLVQACHCWHMAAEWGLGCWGSGRQAHMRSAAMAV